MPGRSAWIAELPALCVVALAVAWNLVNLGAETHPVAYLDDAAMHEQMVRFATLRFEQGQVALTSWYPYLGLGSPHFLHYQSLPALLTGLAGLAVGPGVAFRWSLYLLLALWPISVFVGARLIGLSRGAAACAAAMAPFLMSVKGIGFEQRAYIWVGFGVWTQLWASMALPLAWGFSWRAVRDGRWRVAAAAAVALTVALHFETGYLAALGPPVAALTSRAPIAARVRRLVTVTVLAALAAAWVYVPVLLGAHWASINEPLRGGPLENGYGASAVLHWLWTGQLLDFGRLPVVTVLAGAGLLVALARARREDWPRALLLLTAGCLLLSFGRTTFGSLVSVVPGSSDLFFRRFMMGIQLCALLGAGMGAATAGTIGRRLGERLWRMVRAPRRPGPGSSRPAGPWPAERRGGLLAQWAIGTGLLVALLYPCWSQLATLDRRNSEAIAAQRAADAVQGGQLQRLLVLARRHGPGRVYAGSPTNWGMRFFVGQVQVYKYLACRDVDEVGFDLRTASLMTDPEYYLDPANPGDFRLFAVRYIILPRGRRPVVPSRRIGASGPYQLWETPVRGFIQTGVLTGTVTENRADVGRRSIPLLGSDLPARGAYLRVRWGISGGSPVRLPTSAGASRTSGRVIAQRDDLQSGVVSSTVQMHRAGVVVLSASYDPGWQATVNGRRQRPLMVAPALPAVRVPAGRSTVTFRYRAPGYPLPLLGAGALSLLGFELWSGMGGRSGRRRRHDRGRRVRAPSARRPA
jgi:hypothetical protein